MSMNIDWLNHLHWPPYKEQGQPEALNLKASLVGQCSHYLNKKYFFVITAVDILVYAGLINGELRLLSTVRLLLIRLPWVSPDKSLGRSQFALQVCLPTEANFWITKTPETDYNCLSDMGPDWYDIRQRGTVSSSTRLHKWSQWSMSKEQKSTATKRVPKRVKHKRDRST